MKLTFGIFGLLIFSRGDTTNTNLQNMEPVTEADQEQVPEDLGKLTEVDKANTGRVSRKMAFDLISDCVNLFGSETINKYLIKAAMIIMFLLT